MEDFDITPKVQEITKLPFERLRLVQRFDQLHLPAIRRGVIFVFAGWSGLAPAAFIQFTRALAELDLTGLDVVVLDIDCISTASSTSLWGSNLSGCGEVIWIRDGVPVAQVTMLGKDSAAKVVRLTEDLLDGAASFTQ